MMKAMIFHFEKIGPTNTKQQSTQLNMTVRHMNKKCGSANTTAKNVIEMPARQMNAILAYPRGILVTIYHSLIARVLTILFNVDRADQLGHLSQARQH